MRARLADWAAPARVRVAYPGLWLRPDVYATHGHYLDCHLTVPTLERLSVGAMSRLLGRPAHAFGRVADYEAVTAPMYAWRDAVARDARTGDALNGIATVAARGACSGRRRSTARTPGRARSRRAATGLVAAHARAAPRLSAGGGRAQPRRARAAARRRSRRASCGGAGLRAMGEVAARLGCGDAYVVFGHTHRAGPLPGDDVASGGEPIRRACRRAAREHRLLDL